MHKSRWQRFKEWFCRIYGHSFSDVSMLIFKLKTNELNNDMRATLTCRRCKQVFVHKKSLWLRITAISTVRRLIWQI